MGGIRVVNVNKTFVNPSRSVEVLRDISLELRPGEFVTLIGPSGCGKSTLFRIIAGLVSPDSGTVEIGGGTGVVAEEGAGATEAGEATLSSAAHVVGYMPQRDLLLPWLRLQDNAGLALEMAGAPRSRAREIVQGHLSDFGLDGFANAYPRELSGGMAQRAALLRTVLTGREVLLLDEPFGALDALTRRAMQNWLLQLHAKLQRTVLFITHDVDEAVYLGDRVVLMSPRPGSVSDIVDVELPRPRQQTMAELPEFGHAVARLLRGLGLSPA